MIVDLDRTGTIEGLKETLARIMEHPEVRGLQILASVNNPWTVSEVDALLRSLTLPVFGGMFTGVIYDGQVHDPGTVVIALTETPRVRVIRGLNDPTTDFKAALETAFDDPCAGKTMFVYVDCTSSQIEVLLATLFNHCGASCAYIGGGAGALDFVSRPYVFTNEGVLQSAAVLALTGLSSSIGVSHGWRSLAGPFLITEASGHVVQSLNWRPAFEVYREVVEAHSGKSFDEMPFYELSKFYPFVLGRVGTEGVVRDPVNRNPDGSLLCVGDMPLNALVDIVTGATHSMIRAATKAATTAIEGFQRQKAPAGGFTLLMECISRSLCLGESLARELEAVRVAEMPQVGALTIGEIASSSQNYLEFYNKTAVLGILTPASKDAP